MKITINKDGSLIIDGEGNTTIQSKHNIGVDSGTFKIEDLTLMKNRKVVFKGFIINASRGEKENDQLNYPMAE